MDKNIITFDKVESAIGIYRNAVTQIFKGINTIQDIKTGLGYLEKEAEEFNGEAFGSDSILNAKNPIKRRKRALYITGPPPFYMYKDLFLNSSDEANFIRQELIVRKAETTGIDLDIKFNPIGQE